MTQIKKGLILPDLKDLLQLYLLQAKDEETYLSNQQIADLLTFAFEKEDLEEIINIISNELVD